MTKKRWQVSPLTPAEFRAAFPEIDGVVLQLLYNRGLRAQAQIDEFLQPDYGTDVHDPFKFLAMERAVGRVVRALENGERILVYGDYDADGVCAAALLVSSLEAFGAAPGVYLPFRETEGYGLNAAAANEIVGDGYRLVITVDCGITNVAEVAALQMGGVDVIVTDHHNPPDVLPQAFTLLDPKLPGETYPYPHLSGTGMAFKLVQALLADATRAKHPKLKFPPVGYEKWLLDLVAVSTVADMCELVGENRTLVHYGLTVLRKTRRLGLRALMDVAKVAPESVDTQAIGFGLAPRLNAAGRMNHASSAYHLLVKTDPTEVERLAEELDEQNRKRQQLTEQMRQSARGQVTPAGERKLLFAHDKDWSPGLVGLVAGRIADEFGRPAVVVGRTGEGNWVGSGRSVHGFNITEALSECREYLSRFGGHYFACGFTVKDEASLKPFREHLEHLAAAALTDDEVAAILPIDAELDLAQVTFQLQEELQRLEPFGTGNPKPRFVSRALQVQSVTPVGNTGRHLRLMVTQHGGSPVVKLIGFSIVDRIPALKTGDVIDVVFEVDINQWNGNRELQLKIVDVQKVN